MKIEKLSSMCSLALFSMLSAQAQGTFQNLNFEQANPIPVHGTPYVTAASALPDWTVTLDGTQQTQITENAPSLGETWVMLAGPNDPYGYAPIDGNYSVLLQGIVPGSTASISQTGLIPTGTQSLYFEAEPGFGAMDVLVGTQIVPFSAVGSGPNYTLYGANISAWAGDTEELTFSALGGSYNNWEVDDITLSTTTVTPEPSPLVLAGLGGLLFALYRRFAPHGARPELEADPPAGQLLTPTASWK
jgi:hypothetical protein